MKKKTLQPQIIAPVPRTTKGNSAAQSISGSVEAAQYGGGVAASTWQPLFW